MDIIMSIQDCLLHGWMLVARKMVERNAFIANPKNEYHVSQWGEHDWSAHNKMNGDYYKYLSLSNFIDKH